ncbi:transcription termination factor 2, mitochondrial [Heterodontus francisci]|uniref:transcription termination factor 2, mitochondrial n=1 Tax=Heterodontus francisci TaxID=7792 RepID=UPI00355C46A1
MYGSSSLCKMVGLGLLSCRRCREHLWSRGIYRDCLQFTTSSTQQKENRETVDSLHRLSVDVAKIRQLKSWVLLADVAYVNETANILKEMGAEGKKVALILERCPEAVLCTPAETTAQRELWERLCPNEKELVRIVERFPESFFTVRNHRNRQDNVKYFQTLNLNKRIISRLLASSPQTFCSSVDKNRAVIETLQRSYLQLGGTQANMRVWLMKLLSQNPFILLKPPEMVHENLAFLRSLGFSSAELLKLFSKLKGLISELSASTMAKSAAFCAHALQCSDEGLRLILLSCPALLYFSVPVLEERLNAILQEGFSVEQVKASPAVLELSTQIVHHRIRRLVALGYDVKRGSLELLKGTKKDFEASCGKVDWRKERPLFNPVSPLSIED